ncbi:hypothetical protein ACPV36_12280 [Photobacterium damselae]|uniref:hypothetical protein n=1 Tax=Photobacterium damselae TaxID=38293 RepID=UPI0040691AF8
MMKKIYAVLIFFFSQHASAVDLITKNEQIELDTIKNKFKIEVMYSNANKALSDYNYRQSKYILTLEEIKNIEKILLGLISNNDYESNDSQSILTEVNNLFHTKQALLKSQPKYDTLIREYKNILNEFKNINENKEQEKTEILALQKEIIKRLRNDLKKIKKIHFSDSFNIVCSKSESLRSCIDDQRSNIEKKLVNRSMFTSKDSELSEYKVIDAQLDLSGNATVSVSGYLSTIFNNKILNELNKKLDLIDSTVILKSNMNVEWFVDGVSVGKGKEVRLNLSNGYHGILASINGQQESSIEYISGNDTYRYNFKKDIAVSNDTPLQKDINKETHKALFTKNIFYISNNDGAILSHSKDDADYACKSYDGKLATFKEIIDAMNMPNEKKEFDLLKYYIYTSDQGLISINEHQNLKAPDDIKTGIGLCLVN